MYATDATDLNAPLPPQGGLDALTDEELYTALDAVVLYRNAKQQELLPAVPGEGEKSQPEPDAMPPKAYTLEWQIMQSGALLTKLYRELCRRNPSRFKVPPGLIAPQKGSGHALNRHKLTGTK